MDAKYAETTKNKALSSPGRAPAPHVVKNSDNQGFY